MCFLTWSLSKLPCYQATPPDLVQGDGTVLIADQLDLARDDGTILNSGSVSSSELAVDWVVLVQPWEDLIIFGGNILAFKFLAGLSSMDVLVLLTVEAPGVKFQFFIKSQTM